VNWYLNEWGIYLAFAILQAPKHFTIISGVSPHPSTRMMWWQACTEQQHQCAHHTPVGEERESDRAKSKDVDYKDATIDKDQRREFGKDTGISPLLFARSSMGFLMTTGEQGPKFNVSSKGLSACCSVPVAILGN